MFACPGRLGTNGPLNPTIYGRQSVLPYLFFLYSHLVPSPLHGLHRCQRWPSFDACVGRANFHCSCSASPSMNLGQTRPFGGLIAEDCGVVREIPAPRVAGMVRFPSNLVTQRPAQRTLKVSVAGLLERFRSMDSCSPRRRFAASSYLAARPVFTYINPSLWPPVVAPSRLRASCVMMRSRSLEQVTC